MNIDEPVVEKKTEEPKKKTLSVIGKIDLENIDSKKKNINTKSEEKEKETSKTEVEAEPEDIIVTDDKDTGSTVEEKDRKLKTTKL